MSVDGYTKIYGIIGNPVQHSLSPLMHNTSFHKLNLNSIFLAFEVTQVQNALEGIRALNIQGISVTMPHKETVIPYLDHIDPIAKKIGAVNSIANLNNQLTGYNTDGLGAYYSIVKKGFDLNQKNVLIIGNGGTAKAIAYTLLDKSSINHLYIVGRNQKNLQYFTTQLEKELQFTKYSTHMLSNLDDLAQITSQSDIIINTSPIGMLSDENSPLPKQFIKSNHLIFEVVYKPLNTMLLRDARQQKANTIDGLDMLINQGLEQFRIWTGHEAPENDIQKVLRSYIK